MKIRHTKTKKTKRKKTAIAATPPIIYIQKVGTVRLQYTTDHYVAFSCYTHELKPCYLLLPAKEALRSSKIETEILNYDLYYSDLPSLVFQAKQAAKCRVDRKGTIAISNGWLDDRHGTFVYSDRVFHAPRAKEKSASALHPLIIACPDFDSGRKSNLAGRGILPADMAVARVRKGTQDQWQADVAKPALCSSPMMLSIAAVFAAPLMAPMDIDPFILYLAGHTSGGKTSTLLPVASAIGIAKARMPTWKNTDAGLEQQAHQEFPDMAFPIDELAHVGSEAEVFKKIDATAYMFDAGVNKRVHDRAGSAISRRPRRVTGSRAIVVTSYERTLAEIEVMVGNQFRPGVRVRVVEIPMSVTKNAVGIFDKLPKDAGKGGPAAIFANKLVKDMRRACQKNSGEIFIAYIKEVVAHLPVAKKFVRARMEWFMAHTKFNRSKGEEYRRAEHFAFLYGAGAYAIHLQLLPWKRAQLLRAVRACYRASRSNVPAVPNPMAALEVSLMQHLDVAQRVVSWPKADEPAVDGPEIDGWSRGDSGSTSYRIKAGAFRRWFPTTQSRVEFERHLIATKILAPGKKGAATVQARVPKGEARLSMYELRIAKGTG